MSNTIQKILVCMTLVQGVSLLAQPEKLDLELEERATVVDHKKLNLPEKQSSIERKDHQIANFCSIEQKARRKERSEYACIKVPPARTALLYQFIF